MVMSRSALCLRFLQTHRDSEVRKRHVKTVLVKNRRAKNNLRKKHAAVNFTFSTKEYLKDIVSVFEPDFGLIKPN